ncbi:hypothetical protein [Halorhabdus rudnickae]|uniref:hypothetical protein n=1 Tax=Halorhabdus rudnickae TaxID=1775544 RepID=UPI001083B146|nr:hypothetical protein [Halorhabdus rudnickae]
MAETTEEMASTETLHLHVSVGDVTIEVEGPIDDAETWFEGLKEDYLNGVDSEAVAAAATRSTTDATNSSEEKPVSENTGTSTNKSRSLQEYYKMANNLTKRDAALIVGWYLEYQSDQSNFTRPEVEDQAQDAKIQLGANVSRDLSKQVEESHLQKVDTREGSDVYELTLTGEDYVEDELLSLEE